MYRPVGAPLWVFGLGLVVMVVVVVVALVVILGNRT